MKRERAYVDNRRNQILEVMKKNPKVRVDELAELFNVSLVTIRRDLQYLEDKHLLVRFYGGAAFNNPVQTPEDELEMYRKFIAMYAASLVEEGDSLFINTSSTAIKMLEYIDCKNVSVITNNGKAINMDYKDGVNIILTGGEIRHPKEAMVGDFAIRNVQIVFPRKAFIGCSGISHVSGMTTENAGEVKINELMIENTTEQVYVLADHTKIGRNSSFTSASIDKIKYLITDEKAPEDVLNELRGLGVKIHQVRKGDF